MDAEGTLVLKVPRGIESLLLYPLEHSDDAMWWRQSRDMPFEKALVRGTSGIMLKDVNHDISTMEIVHYKVPTLVVNAVSKDGSELLETWISADYLQPPNPNEQAFLPAGANQPTADFQSDGNHRFRCTKILPDVNVSIVARAKGYQSKPVTVRLREGETKSIDIVLEKN